MDADADARSVGAAASRAACCCRYTVIQQECTDGYDVIQQGWYVSVPMHPPVDDHIRIRSVREPIATLLAQVQIQTERDLL